MQKLVELKSLAREIRRKYKCHTLILYGSRARNEETGSSDYDLLGIRDVGPVVHDTRKIGPAYLDAFIYPESKCSPANLMRVRGGKVLFQKDTFGDALLARVERTYKRGPKPLSDEEANVRRIWADKILKRAEKGDAEGNFRRVWLLTTLLEDYFALRKKWYEGPKAALSWLQENDPKIAAEFDAALTPGARISRIKRLVRLVIRKA